ncbi:hypothetical protein HID58_037237, partial [Brassica napus]
QTIIVYKYGTLSVFSLTINLQIHNGEKSYHLHILIFFFFLGLNVFRRKMVDPPVGYRFHPTDEEIVGDYVRPKNIESNTSRVDEVMNTVDIYEFDPWELPYKSRINSTDEDQQNRGERQSRRTKSGFWKKTGVTMDIMRKRGNREKIGEKRVFVFQYSKILGGPSKPKSDWVMHEHVATFLSPDSPNQTMMMMKYTVCKVMFKGDERVLSSSSSSSAGQIQHHHLSLIPHVNSNNSGGLSTETEVEPRQFTGFPHLEEETLFLDEILRGFNNPPTDDWNSLFSNDEEQGNTMFMQEDRNDYRPKMSLTGVFIGHSDDDSDSDSISSRTTTGSIKTSSTCVTFGCSNHPTDLPESPSSSTIESGSVSEALGTNTVTSERKMNPCDDDAQLSEIGGDKIDQEMVIKNKRAENGGSASRGFQIPSDRRGDLQPLPQAKTGVTTNIMRKRGDCEKIGEKRVFVFQYSKILGGSKPKSDWVMHEYVATFVFPAQTPMVTYALCKRSSSELHNLRQFSGFLHLEEETQMEDAIRRAINNLSPHDLNCLLNNDYDDEEQGNTQEVDTKIQFVKKIKLCSSISRTYQFIPTDQEIVDYYIRLKNRGGSDTNHVDKAIRAVDICSFDPWELPSKSRRESRDQDNRGERQSRKTKSGFWKKTGPTMDIFQKRGDREKIGEKRVLVFHLSGSKSKSDWVMHEYVATFLPPTDQVSKSSLDASKEKYDDVQGTEMGEYHKMDQEVINNKRGSFCYRKIPKLHQENSAMLTQKVYRQRRKMVDPVGYRFHPTDEEIVGDYVRPKNIESNTSHVDEVMNTVDIYEFDPWELLCKSRINSTDEDQQNRGERQSRRTKSGFWKKTGVTMDIMRKRGNREKIGEKRVFVFQYSKILGGPSKPKSDWVMHEYVATFLSPNFPNQTMTYTVCKVMFKGDERVLSSSSSAVAGEIEHGLSLIPLVDTYSAGLSIETEVDPRQFTGFLHLEEESQFEDEMFRVFNNLPTDDWNSLFNNDEEQGNTMFMQEDRNDYRPKKSLTGVFVSDDDSDSDSITTTCSLKSSSTCVTFGSSNPPIYLPDSPCLTIESVSLTQEVSKALGANSAISEKKMSPCDDDAQVNEIGGDQMGQEMVIKNKRAGFIYRMIQKFTKKIKLCSCEIVDYYIRLKNRGGSDTNHVDKAIRAVDICSFDPWELPSKSRRESRDQDNRGERQSRKTKSGFWKKTGPTMDIFQKRGDREKIGEKRVLVFHLSGSKSKSDWVMHEYVATFLPPTDQDPSQFNVSTDDFNCFLNYNDDEEEQGNTMFMHKSSLDASKEKYDDVQGTEMGEYYKMDQEVINSKIGSFFTGNPKLHQEN